MGIRQEAKKQSRQKIINAMQSLLNEKKADSISIEEITEKAGIAKGSFYTHFRRKEDVISVITMQRYEEMMKNISDLKGNIFEQIRKYLICSSEIIEEMTLQVAQNWMKSVVSPIEGEHSGKDKYKYDYDNIFHLLENGVKSGELSEDTPTDTLCIIIMNNYYGAVANWCITDGEKQLAESIKEFCEYGLKSILNEYKK